MVIGICDDDKQWRESCKRTLEGLNVLQQRGNYWNIRAHR